MKKCAILWVLLLAYCLAPAQVLSSFADFGYKDVTIHGLKGSCVYYFKLPESFFSGEAKIVLRLLPSQELDHNHSYATALLNDQPVRSFILGGDSLVIPLSVQVSQASPYLKLEIRADLSISGNICNDLNNNALWVTVSGSSTLDLPAQVDHETPSLSEDFARQTILVTPDHPTVQEVGQAACVYAKMLQDHPGARVFNQSRKPDSVTRYILIGPVDKLSPAALAPPVQLNATDGLIFLVGARGGDSAALAGKRPMESPDILVVTSSGDSGLQKAVNALLNDAVLQSAMGTYMVVKRAAALPGFGAGKLNYLTLRDLGANQDIVSGIGSLDNLYHFQLSDFTSHFRDLDIRLVSQYSGLRVNSTERGYCNLFVNGMLLSTISLDETGALDKEVRISSFYLQKYNTLNVQFVFYPAENACSTGFANFFAQVDIDHSWLREEGHAPYQDELSFSQFPQLFFDHPLDAVVSPGALDYAAPVLGKLISQLNGSSVQPMRYPAVFSSGEYSSRAGFRHGLIAILDPGDSLIGNFKDIPVHVNENYRLYNGVDGKVLYDVREDGGAAIGQIFYGDHSGPVLLLTATGGDPGATLSSLSEIISGNTPYLNSNVVVAGVQRHFFFNIEPGTQLVSYVNQNNGFEQFWSSYYLFVLAILLLIVLLLFIYVRSKVNQSRQLFEDKPGHE